VQPAGCIPQNFGARVSDSSGVKMKQSYEPKALRTSVRLTLAAIAVSSFHISTFASEQLEVVTVTANRMPSLNVLAPTTVVTRDEIERLQINDLPTLLSRQSGIDVTMSGGIGKSSRIFIRGTNSDHILVLVDGVKWHSATLGSTSIQDFPVEQIERIEIVRGPRSGLYGAEAIGGVIQIFTREGQQGIDPYAKVSYGTHNSKKVATGVSGGNGDTSYNLSFNHQSTDGINAKTDKNPDDDGYRNNSVSAKLQHRLNESVAIGFNFIRAEGLNEFDGFNASNDYFGESVQQVLGADIAWNVTNDWLLDFQLAESRDQSESFTNSTSSSVFNTQHRFTSLINTFDINPEHRLNVGLDYETDQVDSSSVFTKTSRDNKAGFISWQGQSGKQNWLLSTRHDNNEAFGSYNTGVADWGYWLQDGLQITASLGTAFKAPTFNDLYFPFTDFGYGFTFEGNPNLKPEKSRNYGLGLNVDSNFGTWSVQLYKSNVRDLISSTGSTMVNIAEAKIKGIEFDFITEISGWAVALNATVLKSEDEATGKILRRRAQRLANIHADKQWGNWSAGASWKLSGHRFEDTSNAIRLDGYGLLDLRAAYQIDSAWSLQASVSNVLNKDYQTVNNFNSLKRTAMLTLSYTP